MPAIGIYLGRRRGGRRASGPLPLRAPSTIHADVNAGRVRFHWSPPPFGAAGASARPYGVEIRLGQVGSPLPDWSLPPGEARVTAAESVISWTQQGLEIVQIRVRAYDANGVSSPWRESPVATEPDPTPVFAFADGRRFEFADGLEFAV